MFTYCVKIERQNKPGEMFMLMLTYSVSFILLRPGLGIFSLFKCFYSKQFVVSKTDQPHHAFLAYGL